jgi:ParB family chromosome partitioning protein
MAFSKHRKNKDRFENSFKSESESSVFSTAKNKLYSIDINLIEPNPYQPRFEIDDVNELKASIAKLGLLQPLTVSKVKPNGKYTLIYGHRRLQALKELNKDDVEVLIEDNSDEQLRLKALAENSQRKDLDFLELAFAYKEILDTKKISYDELAQDVNKSKAYISQVLSILKLNSKVREKIKEEKYKTLSVLNKLNQVENNEQLDVYEKIKKLTRDEAVDYINMYIKESATPKERKNLEIKNNRGKYNIKLNTNNLSSEEKKEAISKLYQIIKQLKED